MVEVPRASVRLGDLDSTSVVECHGSTSVDDRGNVAGLAVDDAEPAVVSASDHAVADRERAAVGHKLVARDPAELAEGVTTRAHATDRDAATLGIDPGEPVVLRPFELRGRDTDEPWATGITTYPLDGLNDDARARSRNSSRSACNSMFWASRPSGRGGSWTPPR